MDTDNTNRIEHDGRTEEPLASLIKLIAEYGEDEVMEALSIAEIYTHE